MKMEKILYKFIINFLFLIHLLVGIVLLFFWQFESLYFLYLTILLLTLASNQISGICFLAELEFYFRRKINPSLNYNTFLSFHFNELFGYKLTPKIAHLGLIIFLWFSLGANIIYWILN